MIRHTYISELYMISITLRIFFKSTVISPSHIFNLETVDVYLEDTVLTNLEISMLRNRSLLLLLAGHHSLH